jgi:hypothetical protein
MNAHDDGSIRRAAPFGEHQTTPAGARDAARSRPWEYEDYVYRFYHQSFKVFGVQSLTLEIVTALRALLPEATMNRSFLAIVGEGTGKTFAIEMNAKWDATARPLLEAFFHARFMLEMAIKYGRELNAPPESLPSGWAAVLYLYGLR